MLLHTQTSRKGCVHETECRHIYAKTLTQHLPLHPMVIFIIYSRHWHTPCQVSRDGARPQPRAHARIDDLALVVDDRVWRPLAQRPAPLHPRLRLRLEHVELDVHMRRGLGCDRVLPADEAAWVDEVDRVERTRTDVTLVTTGVLVVHTPVRK